MILLVLMSHEADGGLSAVYQGEQITHVSCTSQKSVKCKNALPCIAVLWPKH